MEDEADDGEQELARTPVAERLHPSPRPIRQRRPTASSTRSGRSIGARQGPTDGVDVDSLGTGKLADLFRRLHAIPILSTTNDFPDVETLDRAGADWELGSVYKGRPQPPLGARLETVVNFLAEEDVDRCMHWTPRFAEVVSYLEWLGLEDEKRQLRKARPQTRAMFNDAVFKAKAHVLFEKHHYEPTPLEITKPPKFPLKPTRLNWMVNAHDFPVPSHNPVPDKSDLLPRPVPPRPAAPVNTLPIDGQNTAAYNTLVAHERDYWQHTPATSADPADPSELTNLAYVESGAFTTFSAASTTGWIRHDPRTPHPLLPDGTPALPANRTSLARERGARRAGLQQALHGLAALAGTLPTSHARPVVFPVSGSALAADLARRDAPQWTPPRLATADLPAGGAEWETLPTVVAYRGRAQRLRRMRELARLRVEERFAPSSRRWATLPRNLVVGGPMVWRGLDPEAQAAEDLLRTCKVVAEMLGAVERKVPRGLLTRVLRLVLEGLDGSGVPPGGVRLADEEWEAAGRLADRVPRFVDAEEVQWLRFLGSACVNRGSWEGRFVPDAPREKYKLFLIFAARVQKLLDDPNPEGLFGRYDARVTVEELLEAMNAGRKSSAVTKCEFKPHDACCWLDRLRESGHVRFQLDPACYGIVSRPKAELFPEHRVIWPTASDKRERPAFLGYIADWAAVVAQGAEPDVSDGSAISNFFSALAFRLGYTIAALEQRRTNRSRHAHPTPAHHFDESITKWTHACTTAEGQDAEPTADELRLIRTSIIDELAANKTMLGPGRTHTYFDRNGEPQTVLVRDHNWDWAAKPKPTSTATATATPHSRRRQFWSVNRWPLGSGHLSAGAEHAVRSDADTDPAQTYDPAAQDPTTDPRYTRPKLRPYRQEKVQYRPGPATYPVGDTRLQREAVEAYMVDMVHRAVGLDTYKPTWSESLARLNPFSRPSSRAGDAAKLPTVSPRAVPKSWDPQAPVGRRSASVPRRRAHDNDDDDDDGDEMEVDDGWFGFGDDDEVHNPRVDVEMAGMGEPWMVG
ncbi:hypothetical protein BT67DRAFT_416732 [Trichocladium antarcticum]|uniref:Uncharacterized protein n=1 Tax=Trichocladium antarcticum TaxID=1450529 RepID=A0AAN6UPP1_9PEZI|nr:hypothetical protein BT67DRAFT_416732 [Trichocladium antarcticum]